MNRCKNVCFGKRDFPLSGTDEKRTEMKKFIVISHTHWDREWYMPFSVFRLKLADLIDRLFAVLEKDPDFIFHLDAQTVVLEDYLAIRPQNEEKLKNYIASGNIRVGPWYLQNDFYLTDGEVTVRNLMIGTEIANRFGKCGTVGYAPDQFGNISQLPQILKDFGLKAFVFGRGFRIYERKNGVRSEKKLPAEFEWVGADGTKCFAVHLKYWYNNAQHIPAERELAHLLLDINERNFEGLNVSPYILLMNGVDHLEAQGDVREIIAGLREDGADIEQTSLDDYIEKTLAATEGKQLFSYRGALNKGGDYDLLKGCWSSRCYLKTQNVRSQDLVIHRLEPLYAYLEESGFAGVYPADELKYLWKELMKNHPHDNICGCSRDETHRHMEDSFARIREMGEELLSRGMKIAAAHGRHPLAKEQNYSVTVFNGTEREQSAVAETCMRFLRDEKIGEFALVDESGNSLPYEIVDRSEGLADVFSPLNLPGVLDVDYVRLRFYAEKIPAYTAKQFAVVPHVKGVKAMPSEAARGIENEFYELYAEEKTLVLRDKRTGNVYRNPILLEDSADKGDSYVYRVSPVKPLVLTPYSIEKPVRDAFGGTLTLSFDYDCPACYDFSRDCRAEEKVKNEVRVTLALQKGSETIGISYRIENRARDHRIRILLKSGFSGGKIYTDSPFDYAERENFESCDETESDTHHNSTFVQLTESGRSLITYTEGQHETEAMKDGLAFTLLRATGVINRNPVTFLPAGGPQWDVPENQILRAVEGRLGAEYSAERSGADCYVRGKFFRNGLICHADSFDSKKYSGGRFAVQTAELERLYYLEDKYAGCALSAEPIFTCDCPYLVASCHKKAEKGGTIVRFVNLADTKQNAEFTFRGKMYVTDMAERKERFAGETNARLTFAPKQIITVRFSYV